MPRASERGQEMWLKKCVLLRGCVETCYTSTWYKKRETAEKSNDSANSWFWKYVGSGIVGGGLFWSEEGIEERES